MSDTISAWMARLSDEQRVLSVALVRIGLGGLLTIYYTLHLLQRNFLWGPRGVFPLDLLRRAVGYTHGYTLYQFSDSSLYFNLVYFSGFAVSLLFALGYKARITSILFFAFAWSLYQRNYLAVDGGDNIAIIIAFYLMFADTGRRLAIDARNGSVSIGWVRGLLHNLAVWACMLQISILYFFSALAKVQSPLWLDGSAIYYILRVQEFSSFLSQPLFRYAPVCVLICYATIVFEMLLPFEIWKRGLRVWMLAGAVLLHLGIGFAMGLMYFSLNMIAIDLIIPSDDQYERGWKRLKDGIEILLRRFNRTPPVTSGY